MSGRAKHERYAISRPVKSSAGQTGSWRVFRPVIDKEKCTRCGLCVLYCPEAVIGRLITIDLTFCKGCGIYAHECTKRAIAMVREEK
jgi:pyruvate ferredoxin oxidoreductase delta subunit